MNSNLKELQTIPGVGKSISQILWNIGIEKVSDLKGKDPEELYFRFLYRSRMEVPLTRTCSGI